MPEKQKKKKENKFAELLKKHPGLSPRLMSFVMMAGMIFGGARVGISTYRPSAPARDKIETVTKPAPATSHVILDAPQDPVEKPATYGEFLEKIRPIEPLLIADLASKEGINLNKDGLHVPYYDKVGKCWTIGFGSTRLQNGKKVTANTKPLTPEQAYELVQWHLEHETFFIMYCYNAGVDSVNINNTEEAFTMASIIYNTGIKMIEKPTRGTFKNVNLSRRTGLLHQDWKKYGNDLPAELVRRRFEEYPVTNPASVGAAWMSGQGVDAIAGNIGNFLGGGGGIQSRRWIEAGILLGEIEPEMLLNSPMGAVGLFFARIGRDRKNWFTGDGAERRVNKSAFAEFRKWLMHPVDKAGYSLEHFPKVKDYLPEYAQKMCESGLCQVGNKEFDEVYKKIVNGETIENTTKSSRYLLASKKINKTKHPKAPSAVFDMESDDRYM